MSILCCFTVCRLYNYCLSQVHWLPIRRTPSEQTFSFVGRRPALALLKTLHLATARHAARKNRAFGVILVFARMIGLSWWHDLLFFREVKLLYTGHESGGLLTGTSFD